MNRRTYLKLGAAGAGVVGSLAAGATLIGGGSAGGPPNPRGWRLAFEETFDGDGLDSDIWNVGWGWGLRTDNSPASVSPRDVVVRDGALELTGSHDGSRTTAGAVNTKDKVTFGPGTYLEARIEFADRAGFLNAFWSKPNSETWPPEIDVVELWQDGTGWDDTHVSRHHLHYSTSTNAGDTSTYRDLGVSYRPGDDLTENFHVYAVEWRPDAIVHYVDGTVVREWTDETLLAAMRRGAPFYVMLSINVDKIGTADRSEPWPETMLVDWVRCWRTEPGTSSLATRRPIGPPSTSVPAPREGGERTD